MISVPNIVPTFTDPDADHFVCLFRSLLAERHHVVCSRVK
jgi:hypothetical protein